MSGKSSGPSLAERSEMHERSREVDVLHDALTFWSKEWAEATEDLKRTRQRRNSLIRNGWLEEELAGVDHRIAAKEKIKQAAVRTVKQLLREHPIWPFLEDKPGLRGPRVARIVSIIYDPRRFPGQPCNGPEVHFSIPIYKVGDSCPHQVWVEEEGKRGSILAPCPGTMCPERKRTGVRSVWHYFGLFPDENGNLIKRHKGQSSGFRVQDRALFIGPEGIGDAIIRHRTPVYRAIYDEKKARFIEEGKEKGAAHDRAKIIACKEFLRDLLMAWKYLEFGIGSGPKNCTV